MCGNILELTFVLANNLPGFISVIFVCWICAGSSAGAGSGEFHVYRHLRRREYQRQDFLERISDKASFFFFFFSKAYDYQMGAALPSMEVTSSLRKGENIRSSALLQNSIWMNDGYKKPV